MWWPGRNCKEDGRWGSENWETGHSWPQSSSMSAVKFLFVSKDECEQKAAELKKLSLKPMKGTMEVHAVSGQGNSTVMTRAVSCYCDLCLEGSFCTGWRKVVVVSEVQQQSAPDPSAGPENNPCCSTGGECNDLRSNMYVAAVYDGRWYIGKLLQVDSANDEVEVSFMEQARNMYRWPKRPDILWLKFPCILWSVQEPHPSGKSQRMFKLTKADTALIESKFKFYIARKWDRLHLVLSHLTSASASRLHLWTIYW